MGQINPDQWTFIDTASNQESRFERKDVWKESYMSLLGAELLYTVEGVGETLLTHLKEHVLTTKELY